MPNYAYAYDNIVPFHGNAQQSEPEPASALAESAASESAAAAATTATARHTEPGVSEYWRTICEDWNNVFGSGIPIPIAKWIQRIIDNGMDPELISIAINDTAWAPRPTPAYFRGIVNRCWDNGIKTASAYAAHEAERDLQYQKRSRYINANDSIF